MINYVLICPLYVGFASAFVTLVLQTWHRIYVAEDGWTPSVVGRRRIPAAFVVTVVVAAAAALTTQYLRECLDSSIYSVPGWYVEIDAQSGVRSIGLVGIYYALLNFGLLVTCLVGLVFVVPYMAIAADIARVLRSEDLGSALKFDEFRGALFEFTQSYVAVKLLAVVIMMNAYTWKWEKPVGSLNFVLLAGVLSIVGVFLVSFPRYYVELEWFYFETRRARAEGRELPAHSDDLRTRGIRVLAYVIDIFFGVGFVWSIWG